MNQVEESIHLKLRERQMNRILDSPAAYKVCDQCQSISKNWVKICPVCHAYRWEFNPEVIVQTAKLIGTNAIPVTSAVVPRL